MPFFIVRFGCYVDMLLNFLLLFVDLLQLPTRAAVQCKINA